MNIRNILPRAEDIKKLAEKRKRKNYKKTIEGSLTRILKIIEKASDWEYDHCTVIINKFELTEIKSLLKEKGYRIEKKEIEDSRINRDVYKISWGET